VSAGSEWHRPSPISHAPSTLPARYRVLLCRTGCLPRPPPQANSFSSAMSRLPLPQRRPGINSSAPPTYFEYGRPASQEPRQEHRSIFHFQMLTPPRRASFLHRSSRQHTEFQPAPHDVNRDVAHEGINSIAKQIGSPRDMAAARTNREVGNSKLQCGLAGNSGSEGPAEEGNEGRTKIEADGIQRTAKRTSRKVSACSAGDAQTPRDFAKRGQNGVTHGSRIQAGRPAFPPRATSAGVTAAGRALPSPAVPAKAPGDAAPSQQIGVTARRRAHGAQPRPRGLEIEIEKPARCRLRHAVAVCRSARRDMSAHSRHDQVAQGCRADVRARLAASKLSYPVPPVVSLLLPAARCREKGKEEGMVKACLRAGSAA